MTRLALLADPLVAQVEQPAAYLVHLVLLQPVEERESQCGSGGPFGYREVALAEPERRDVVWLEMDRREVTRAAYARRPQPVEDPIPIRRIERRF